MSLLDFIAQTFRIAIPFLFAAMGGVMSERAGLVALSLEGYMLGGAFCAVIGSFYSGSAVVGVLVGVAAGVALALLYGAAAIRFKADQIVIGIAINLLVVGLTTFFLRLAFDSSSNSPRVKGVGVENAGSGVMALVLNPMFWLAVVAVAGVWWLLSRSVFGLRVRAVGEHPQAAATVGISVPRIRYASVALAGALASLGGVYLALDQHQFSGGMTAGRGFIALAATIFGRWEPVRAAIACLFFAAAETLQIQLQGTQAIPSQFVGMIPYLLTIIALAGVVGRAVPPAALGKASE